MEVFSTMSSELCVLLFALVGLTSCITMNFSVVSIFVKDWWDSGRLLPFDQILLSTAATGVALQFSVFFDAVLYYSRIYVVVSNVVHLCDVAVFYFILELHFWQTTLLSIYYCAKLVNFSHRFLAWLKMKILATPGHLLLALEVILAILALPLIWTIQISSLGNRTHHPGGNEEEVSMNNPYNAFSMVIGCCFPFTVTLTCIGLSVRSLVSHVWRIKQKSSEFSSSPQIRAHVRASTTMVLCAVVNLSLILNAVVLFQIKLYLGTMVHFIFWFIFMSHPTIQIIILIIGNSKLKSRLQTIWRQRTRLCQ